MIETPNTETPNTEPVVPEATDADKAAQAWAEADPDNSLRHGAIATAPGIHGGQVHVNAVKNASRPGR